MSDLPKKTIVKYAVKNPEKVQWPLMKTPIMYERLRNSFGIRLMKLTVSFSQENK